MPPRAKAVEPMILHPQDMKWPLLKVWMTPGQNGGWNQVSEEPSDTRKVIIRLASGKGALRTFSLRVESLNNIARGTLKWKSVPVLGTLKTWTQEKTTKQNPHESAKSEEKPSSSSTLTLPKFATCAAKEHWGHGTILSFLLVEFVGLFKMKSHYFLS